MLEGYLVQTCQKITVTANEWGDKVYSSGETLNCRWRYIDTINRVSHQELNDTNSLVHFAPSETINKGDILLFESEYHQVERIWDARRLGESEIQFIKCEVKKLNIAIS